MNTFYLLNKVLLAGTLLAMTILTACEESNDDDVASPGVAYVRVFDIQHGEPYLTGKTQLSVFEWDGSYYGIPELDSIEIPKYTIHNFGDFLLGRTRKYYNNSHDEVLVLYNGGIDYYSNAPVTDLFEYDADRDFYYKSGLTTGRGIYYPNLTHRINVGPVMNGIDYYKWGVFPSGAHTVGFKKVNAIRADGQAYYKFSFDTASFIETKQHFQRDAFYSLILSNQDRKAEKFKLITIKENPAQTFDRQKAYVRFVNTIEEVDGPLDARTETVDVYVRKADNAEVRKMIGVSFDIRYMPGMGEEQQVASGLRRFQVNGELPYIEMEFTEYLNKNDTSFLKKTGTPSYFFFVYAHGESAATGATPLASYTQIFTNVKGFAVPNSPYAQGNCEQGIEPLILNIDKYEPTITTVLIGAGGMYYNLEQTYLRQAYLDGKISD